jgi:hypothetical protein
MNEKKRTLDLLDRAFEKEGLARADRCRRRSPA